MTKHVKYSIRFIILTSKDNEENENKLKISVGINLQLIKSPLLNSMDRH